MKACAWLFRKTWQKVYTLSGFDGMEYNGSPETKQAKKHATEQTSIEGLIGIEDASLTRGTSPLRGQLGGVLWNHCGPMPIPTTQVSTLPYLLHWDNT